MWVRFESGKVIKMPFTEKELSEIEKNEDLPFEVGLVDSDTFHSWVDIGADTIGELMDIWEDSFGESGLSEEEIFAINGAMFMFDYTFSEAKDFILSTEWEIFEGNSNYTIGRTILSREDTFESLPEHIKDCFNYSQYMKWLQSKYDVSWGVGRVVIFYKS